MGNFQKLRVWQIAKALAVEIYKITDNLKFKKDFGFKDQVHRSAVSIPSNIAEGDESGSEKLSIRYFFIAKGSTAELLTQVLIAYEIGYIELNTRNYLIDECNKISSMLSNLIKARNKAMTD